ncbi:transcriptional regulator [Curtobacterium sp. NPDC087080]|uniref:transcriptional regulator n=1 Tax=Curtobacterium sp. NPDC087080 TaxID=3363965 RepID=UPI003816F119
MTIETVVRVRTESTRDFAVPGSLDDLVGPSEGSLRLPDSVYWGPDPVVDLAHWDDIAKAYEATLREGTLADVQALVSPVVLRRWWSSLFLPVRIRRTWESRFPELVS